MFLISLPFPNARDLGLFDLRMLRFWGRPGTRGEVHFTYEELRVCVVLLAAATGTPFLRLFFGPETGVQTTSPDRWMGRPPPLVN